MADGFVRVDRLITEMPWLMFKQPSWTRLEPTSVTGDPRPGLEMRVHDPLWMLARQWQFGELTGEDAGTPLIVRVSSSSTDLAKLVDSAGAIVDLPAHGLLEPLVEAEPPDPAGPGGWVRAEAGQAFLAIVDDAAGTLVDALREHCAHDGAGLPAALASIAVDADRVAAELDAAAAAGAALPTWLESADAGVNADLAAASASWLSWYRAEVASPVTSPDYWQSDRLEYRFKVATRMGDETVVLNAPEFGGGTVDWWAFDVDTTPVEVAEPPAQVESSAALWASRLRFAGMPADRLWEFEDGAVNLGALEVQPHDLARLLFAEYALATGADWLVVPVDVPYGSLTEINWVTYTTTFNERFLVPHTSAAGIADEAWSMFTLDGDPRHRLLVPPAAVTVMEGDAIEDVAFLRDEMANLVWAVERTYRDADGVVHSRDRIQPPDVQTPDDRVLDAELDYQLASSVPDNWIPYMAMSEGYKVIRLHRATVPGQPQLAPLGELIPETDGLVDGEVPREGVRVRRLPMVTRYADGRWASWTARRVSVGRGEGSSGLYFDRAVRRPKP